MITETKFNELKNLFYKVGDDSEISTDEYDSLFDYFMDIDNQIIVWNMIQNEVDTDCSENIIYYTKDREKNGHGQRLNFENFDLLQELMYPYYRYINNEPCYETLNSLSMYITDDVYDFKYDVLRYIFSECEYSEYSQ